MGNFMLKNKRRRRPTLTMMIWTKVEEKQKLLTFAAKYAFGLWHLAIGC